MEPTNNQKFPENLISHLHSLIHQFLRDLNITDTCHEFERDYAVYFDMSYFNELIKLGLWDKVEHYLRGFTSPHNNDSSWKLFFEIQKQKYLEALQRSELEHAKAILNSELSVILRARMDLFYQLASLQHVADLKTRFPWMGTQTSRNILMVKLSEIVMVNPDLIGKFVLPELNGRLEDLAKQSLDAQFSKCGCPKDAWCLLSDHQCPQQSNENPLVDSTLRQYTNDSTASVKRRRMRAGKSVLSVPSPSLPSVGATALSKKARAGTEVSSGLSLDSEPAQVEKTATDREARPLKRPLPDSHAAQPPAPMFSIDARARRPRTPRVEVGVVVRKNQ